jgi:hypothetical protein
MGAFSTALLFVAESAFISWKCISFFFVGL